MVTKKTVAARAAAIIEEIAEVETLRELKALWCFGQSAKNEYGDAQFVPLFKEAAKRLRGQETEEPPVLPVMPGIARMPGVRSPRAVRKYILLKTDVTWSTKPQVHALMEIIAAHAAPGTVLAEDWIIAMLEANAALLATRQPVQKIWAYYKGDHAEGLMAHGNIAKA